MLMSEEPRGGGLSRGCSRGCGWDTLTEVPCQAVPERLRWVMISGICELSRPPRGLEGVIVCAGLFAHLCFLTDQHHSTYSAWLTRVRQSCLLPAASFPDHPLPWPEGLMFGFPELVSPWRAGSPTPAEPSTL